jgi:hypothetical protein
MGPRRKHSGTTSFETISREAVSKLTFVILSEAKNPFFEVHERHPTSAIPTMRGRKLRVRPEFWNEVVRLVANAVTNEAGYIAIDTVDKTVNQDGRVSRLAHYE